MVPATVDAGLHDIGIELVGAPVELCKVGLGGHTATMSRQTRTEHIGDQNELDLFADWARDGTGCSQVLGRTNQLRMRIAQLIASKPTAAILVDKRTSLESVVHHRARAIARTLTITTIAECVGREGHCATGYRTTHRHQCAVVIRVSALRTDNTCNVTTVVRYGASVADEGELRLCGDVAGKRVIELGIAAPSNAVALAAAGARALAVDPSSDRIALLRKQAEQAEVTVQCHQSDVADLGFATSASIDLVVASHTLQDVDDLARLLRQIHRVLKPEAPFVMAGPHPIAGMLTTADGEQVVKHAYGSGATRSISDVFMAMQRTNFRIDMMHELMPLNARGALTPAVLVIRARKLGD